MGRGFGQKGDCKRVGGEKRARWQVGVEGEGQGLDMSKRWDYVANWDCSLPEVLE